jgi:hypothetical protein
VITPRGCRRTNKVPVSLPRTGCTLLHLGPAPLLVQLLQEAATLVQPVDGQARPELTVPQVMPSHPKAELNIPVNTVENALGQLEAAWTPLLGKLIDCADAGTITAGQVLEVLP